MRHLAAVTFRALIFAAVWAGLAGWRDGYVIYGIVAVTAATALSISLIPPRAPDPAQWPGQALGSARLVGWFLGQTGIGGADVALRALRKEPDVQPAVVTAPLLLPEGPARQTALMLMNLLPGSMVQHVTEGDEVELHTLSRSLRPAEQWEELQRRVAAAYGLRDRGE